MTVDMGEDALKTQKGHGPQAWLEANGSVTAGERETRGLEAWRREWQNADMTIMADAKGSLTAEDLMK